MYKNLVTIILGCLLCLGVFLASFSGGSRRRADFIWNNGTEPQTLDPGLVSGQPEGAIIHGIFEGLTSYHYRTLESMPCVAKSWRVEGLTYIFELREDAWWVRGDDIFVVDGKKRRVTAHDFVYSWRRHLFPETGSEYAYLLHLIEGTAEFAEEMATHWGDVVKRYAAEHPDITVIGIDSLIPSDREVVEDFRLTKWREMVRVRAPDDNTLEVTLKSPAPYFLDLTSYPPLFPVPKEIVEAHGHSWILPENIVTNGPYVLEEWRFNAFVRLRKNQHYWENATFASRLTEEFRTRKDLRPFEERQLKYLNELGSFVEKGLEIVDAFAVEEQNTALNLYLNDDVDRLREIPAEIKGGLIDAHRVTPIPHIQHGTANIYYYYVINTKLPIFKKGENGELGRKLRRALALAVDRQGLIDIVTRGYQTPAYRFVPPGIPDYSEAALFGAGDYDQDVAQAKRLVAEVRRAGVKIPKLKILYNTHEAHAKVAAFVQSLWKTHLDIDTDLTNQEWGVYLDAKRSEQFEVARAGWIGDYNDPNTFLNLFTSDNPNNDSKYNNPVFDRIVKNYCAFVLDHLETAEAREKMLTDIASWHAYDETVRKRIQGDGQTLDAALRAAIEDYVKADEATRLPKAFAVRLLLFEVGEEMVIHDMPAIPFYFYTLTQVWPPELLGFEHNSRDLHPQKYWRWRDGKRPVGPRYHHFPRLRTTLKTAEKP